MTDYTSPTERIAIAVEKLAEGQRRQTEVLERIAAALDRRGRIRVMRRVVDFESGDDRFPVEALERAGVVMEERADVRTHHDRGGGRVA